MKSGWTAAPCLLLSVPASLEKAEGENVYRGESECTRRRDSSEESLRTCSPFVVNRKFQETLQAYL